MRRTRIVTQRLRSLFRRTRQEQELERELEIHLEQLTRQYMSEGMDESEARAEARRQFGPVDLTKEECRDMRKVQMIDHIVRDLSFALRLFRKSPGFTFTAVLSLALGIGANTAIFELFEAVRLRSLPVQRPEDLVTVQITGRGRMGNFRGRNAQFTNPIWEELERRQSAFAGVLAYGDTTFNLSATGEVRNVEGLWVSGSFFPVLGVKAQIGRLLTRDDDRRDCGWPGVVISHGFWQREFAGDPGVLSRTLPVDGRAVPILGVTPPEFFGVEVGRRFDIAAPICSSDNAELRNRQFWFLSAMARRKPGVSDAAVRTDLGSISPGVFEATLPNFAPRDQANFVKLRLEMRPGADGQSGFRQTYEEPLTFLLGMVLFVLLLACANLANLTLARATAREHEFAVRVSLGASRGRLIGQVLMESLLLSFAGAAAGALAAPVIGRLLVNLLTTARDPIFLTLAPNWRVWAFTIAAGVTATVLFGLAPALRAGKADARGTSASREKFVFRQAMLVAQVAVCMILLTAALLFSRSFRNLLTSNLGFQPHGVLVANTFFPTREYPPERRSGAYDELQTRLAAIPGVTAAARSYVIPVSGSGWSTNATDSTRSVNLSSISPGYFQLMQTPLIGGRDFNSSDKPGTPPVAIVNESFARVFFGRENPVGKMLRLDGPIPPSEIVGVVGDSKYRSLAEEFMPIAYLAASQERVPRTTARFLLRTNGSAEGLKNAVAQVVAGFDSRLSIRFAGLESQVEESVLRERLLATLTSAFGVLGTLLALTGVFGVTAYVVARRYREFGVRIALGASGGRIMGLVLRETAVVVAAGVLLGGAVALAGGKAAQTLLYGVSPNDALTFAMVAILLGAGGLLAGLAPAWKASRAAPVDALRAE